MSKSAFKIFIALALVFAAGISLAAGPNWMPGFPMRMGTNVMLMWGPIPGATGYNVYRSEKKGDQGPLLISSPANNHMDMNVPMDKDAAYTVKAVVGGAEGDASIQGVIVGVKPLDAPKFTGDIFQNNQLNVRWDRVPGAAFYNVFKSDSKDGPFNLAGSIQEVMYSDAAVEPGKSYYYQVSAIDKNNVESPRSDIREVKIAKAAISVKKAVYNHAEKLVKLELQANGGATGPYGGPGMMVYNPTDKRIYVAADSGLLAIDLGGNIVARFNAPPDYQGEWGSPAYLAIDPTNGNIWSTWRLSAAPIKIFNTGGALVGEATLDFPKEDYLAENRDADMKEDEALIPSPQGIAVDGDGEVWVYDSVFRQISVFDTKFDRIARFPSPRLRDNKNPHFIQGIGSMVYLPKSNRVAGLDGVSNKMRVFDAAANAYIKKDGEDFNGLDKGGSGPGYVTVSKGIAVTEDGNLAVVAAEASAIQLWNTTDEFGFLYYFQTESGKEKSRMREVEAPVGVVTAGNKLFVSDKLFDTIGIFTIL